MKNRVLMIASALVLCVALAACGAEPEPTQAAPTAAPTQPATEPTQAPTEPEPQPPEVELPDTDRATGNLQFYFGDKAVYAGCPVADLIDLGVNTYTDLEQVLKPGHLSDVIRLRIEDLSLEEMDRTNLFFVAMNTSDTPKKISECRVYSLTINTDKGVHFGSGKETEPFVTGETTMAEILNAYGEPRYDFGLKSNYREIAYFEPFSCAYFSFKKERVRQVTTYYSADVFADLAQELDTSEADQYFGLDACILMNQYLDMTPYLEEELTPQEEAADQKKQQEEAPEEVALSKPLDTVVFLDGKRIELGMFCEDMPEPFGSALKDLKIPLSRRFYYRVGRINDEEFYLINHQGKARGWSNKLEVKGVITQNRNYCNWGEDYSAYYPFAYMELTQDSTIEDILEQYGTPQALDCSSNGRVCYVWMMYEDEAGNTLRIRVDPMMDQIAEIQISKYFTGERTYS